MTFLDLCAGIGGFTLGLEVAGMTCAGQVEIDPFCQKILTRRWPDVPKFGDIKKVRPDELPDADLVCGGYPCQPFSFAGERKGAEDPRHLWPYIRRIVAEKRPNWCVFENVMGHISLGLDEVLADLEAEGYTTATICIPACAVGAPHIRQRVWIVANSDSKLEQQGKEPPKRPGDRWARDGGKILADANSSRKQQQEGALGKLRRRAGDGGETLAIADGEPTIGASVSWRQCNPWLVEPDVGRVAHGVPARTHRIKALGNAVVSQVVEVIGRIIMEVEKRDD